MKQLNSKEAFQLALKYHEKGDIAHAEQVYTAVLQVDPHHAEALHNIGLIFASKGETDSSIASLKKACDLDRTNPKYHNNLGELYRQTGQPDLAEFHLGSATQLKPDYSDAHSNLGLVLWRKGDVNGAKLCFSNALSTNPRNVAALVNTGNLFRSEGSFADAAECYMAALEITPDNPTALAGAGIAYYEMGDYNTSAKYYSRLVNIKPDSHADKVNLALITLRNKDFRKGFQLYEARFKHLPIMEGTQEILWRGTQLNGKTLYVYNEKQGLSGYGDSIQFARYLHQLDKYEPAKVAFRVQKELKELFANGMPDYVQVTSEDCAEYDSHIPLLSLPFVLNARAKTIPLTEGYLKADPARAEAMAENMQTDKLKVGIVFQTSKKHEKHEERSVDQNALQKLYANSDISLFYVNTEEPEKPLDNSVKDMRPFIRDFSDTAAIIENLDLLITADTSVAHLAGAMGKKTVLLLNHLHDWRWFSAKTGKNSEWYSSVTFRVKEDRESWADVIDSIDVQSF